MAAPSQHVRFCTTADGVRIAYSVTGHGPPLLRAPHWLTHLEYDWHTPIWSYWLDELSRDHSLVRFDQRGCGLSDWDAADISFEGWLRDLEAVVDAAGVKRFAVFGMSQGAAIAIEYAARHPERVTHLLLLGAYARGKLKRDVTPREVEDAETQRRPRNDLHLSDLSEREVEVLEQIAQGLDNAQIAARLGMAEKTVRNHVTRIFDKIEVENRSQAIVLAREAGLGQGQPPSHR